MLPGTPTPNPPDSSTARNFDWQRRDTRSATPNLFTPYPGLIDLRGSGAAFESAKNWLPTLETNIYDIEAGLHDFTARLDPNMARLLPSTLGKQWNMHDLLPRIERGVTVTVSDSRGPAPFVANVGSRSVDIFAGSLEGSGPWALPGTIIEALVFFSILNASPVKFPQPYPGSAVLNNGDVLNGDLHSIIRQGIPSAIYPGYQAR